MDEVVDHENDQKDARKAALAERLHRDFGFHPATTDAIRDRHQAVRNACLNAAGELLLVCPEGRELSSALTKLEEAMFHANASIARQPDVPV